VAGRIEDAIVRYTARSCIYQLAKKRFVHNNYPIISHSLIYC